jgi:hypothetical protein
MTKTTMEAVTDPGTEAIRALVAGTARPNSPKPPTATDGSQEAGNSMSSRRVR